ncbi:MAG: lysozyme inhibitor LprI family protein, partial [Cystobacter sp.]
MLVLPLAALLSAAPLAPDVWSTRVCPPARGEPSSNVEMKFKEQQRAECLRKAMNKALDRVLLPLKKSRPEAFKAWMDLQADYNRWLSESCAAVEEVLWVDLSSGERSMGTGYGFTESQCLQRQYAWRGWYADAWARGERDPRQALPGLESSAAGARRAWTAYRDQVRHAASRAPVQVAGSSLPTRQLTREDWAPYEQRLERVLSGPDALAPRQCALAPPPAGDCPRSFAESLFVQL